MSGDNLGGLGKNGTDGDGFAIAQLMVARFATCVLTRAPHTVERPITGARKPTGVKEEKAIIVTNVQILCGALVCCSATTTRTTTVRLGAFECMQRIALAV